MFGHIFVYRLKVLLRDKTMIFWTMIFPIALATFFNLAFGGFSSQGTFGTIPVAVVLESDNTAFADTLEKMSTGESPMFKPDFVTPSQADALLSDGKVAGTITVADTMALKVNQSGISQSILKIFLDRYAHTTRTVSRIAAIHPESLQNMDLTPVTFTKDAPITTGNLDMTLNYFYALIAMACFYGSFFGLEEVSLIQANLSRRGARLNMAPVHKLKAFIYSSLASYTILIGEMMVLMAYLIFVLGVNFGSQIGLILVTVFIGSLAGLTFGSFIAALVKGDANMKTGLLIGITMIGSFLSGMMFAEMKYLVQTKFPLLTIINPVNLLADAFYALYFFSTYNRYLLNISGLLIFTVIFALSTYWVIRRRKYASL